MQKLKIAIEPGLKEKYGSEICWVWRLLLTGIGLAWEEVSLNDAKPDIAYLIDDTHIENCRLSIRANIPNWDQRSQLRFCSLGKSDQWVYPTYEGESDALQLFQAIDGKIRFYRDIIFDVFWLVTGQEERYWPKDGHGIFDLSHTSFNQAKVLRLGLASDIGSKLEKILVDLSFTPYPRWPNGKKAAACVGHDVDYPEIVRWLESLFVIIRQGLGGLSTALSIITGKRHHWLFSSWVEYEKSLNIRTAFYFVARKGSLIEYALTIPDSFYDIQSQRFRELFRYLDGEGFEIGLHPSYRAFESLENFSSEKHKLEKACGHRIDGNRHHYWHMNPDDPEATLLMHEQIGFRYDASLTHDHFIGWRRGLSWPFFPFHQQERRELKTLQVPTGWMDAQLTLYRKYNPGDRSKIIKDLVDKVVEQDGCLMIDFHERFFDEVLFPEYLPMYSELWEYILNSSVFWIATPLQIANHWIDRYHTILQMSQGLAEGIALT